MIFNLHYIIGINDNIHECHALFKSHIVMKEGRSGLSLTHLRGAGFEYIGERHVGSYN